MSWQGAPADEREIRTHAAYCTPNRTSIVCSSAPEPLLALGVGVPRPQLPGDHFGFKRGRVTRHPHAWRSRKASRVVHLLDEPATGAAHSVEARRRRRSWCGRCTSVRPADQCKSGSALRAHALAGSTAVKQAAVRRQAGVERSGRRVAAQVTSMRCEASPMPNAGQGAPSTVPARLPPRSSAQMIDSCVAEHQLARLDEPAGRVRVAEDARDGTARLSGRPEAPGG